MERHGFLRDMLDVKVLILYVMARVRYPIDLGKIYELCYQDESLSYFDLCEAVPQMVASGHLRETDGGLFEITDSGRETGTVMEETVAYPVAQRAKAAVEQFNQAVRRDSFLRTEVHERPTGEASVVLGMDDETGALMTLELMAPDLSQARKLERAFHRNAQKIYHAVMRALLEEAEGKE